MKLVLTTLCALFLSINLPAQSNFYKLSIGAGSGLTHPFTEVQKHKLDLAGYGTVDYHLTPFISLGGELQKGQISGGDVLTELYNRQFINSYMSATVNAKLALGAFSDYNRNSILNFSRDLYVGVGAGIIHNKMKSIARDQVSGEYGLLIKEFSYDIVLPLHLGLNVYFKNNYGIRKLALNFNLQSNVTFDEGLDGYVVSSGKNSNLDIYNYYSVGLKYHIGLIGISKKNLF